MFFKENIIVATVASKLSSVPEHVVLKVDTVGTQEEYGVYYEGEYGELLKWRLIF